MKERLDKLLVLKGLVPSRERARLLSIPSQVVIPTFRSGHLSPIKQRLGN